MKPQAPASVTIECPGCGQDTLHRTLKGRPEGKKLKLVLRCSSCGQVRDHVVESVGHVSLRMIISRGGSSQRVPAEFPADWDFAVGDDFMHGDQRLLVTGIEAGGVRVDAANAREIQTLWTKNFDKARVRISINSRGQTRSLDIFADPEEEFSVDNEIDVDGIPMRIHSIKTGEGRLRRGSALARDIVRIYCRVNRPRKFRGM